MKGITLPRPPIPHYIVIGSGSRVHVGAGSTGKNQQADVHRGEASLLCACVHPKLFCDR